MGGRMASCALLWFGIYNNCGIFVDTYCGIMMCGLRIWSNFSSLDFIKGKIILLRPCMCLVPVATPSVLWGNWLESAVRLPDETGTLHLQHVEMSNGVIISHKMVDCNPNH